MTQRICATVPFSLIYILLQYVWPLYMVSGWLYTMAETSCSSAQIIASRTVVNIKLHIHYTKVFQIKFMGMHLHARCQTLSLINYNTQM